MSEDTNLSYLPRCYSCMSKNDEKYLQTYYVQNGALKSLFQMDQLILCYICKRVAQQTEIFINNVHNNQLLFQNFRNFSDQELDSIQSNINPLVNLKPFLPTPEDIISLSGKEDDMRTAKLEVELEYPPGVSVKQIKKEVEEPEKSHPVDELEGYDEVVSSDVTEDEADYYFLQQQQQLLNKRAKRERNKKKGTASTSVRGLNIIKCITITKAKLEEERTELAKDPRYMEAMYKCTNCIKWFVVKGSFEKHMELHNPANGSHECDICHQHMSTAEQLASHYSRHVKRFKCSKCDLVRKSRIIIKSHFMMKHCGGSKVFHCEYCGKAYSNKTSLHRHKQVTHLNREKVKCEYCERKYNDKSALLAHLITNHAEQVSADVKKPACNSCGREFVSKGALKAHCCDEPSKKYYCAQCDKSFASKFKLKVHLTRTGAHLSYEHLRFECPYCVRRFLNRRDVERHVNGVHLHIKTFKCDTCDKTYAGKTRLDLHIRKEHQGYIPPKTHSCSMCHKLFQEKKSLEAHVRTHTGEKPFQCSQCAAQFAHSGSLHNHVKLVHMHMTRNRTGKGRKKAMQPNFEPKMYGLPLPQKHLPG